MHDPWLPLLGHPRLSMVKPIDMVILSVSGGLEPKVGYMRNENTLQDREYYEEKKSFAKSDMTGPQSPRVGTNFFYRSSISLPLELHDNIFNHLPSECQRNIASTPEVQKVLTGCVLRKWVSMLHNFRHSKLWLMTFHFLNVSYVWYKENPH